jgi:SAM-dependent methyltransferase
MNAIDRQVAYWDGVAFEKAFTHPLDIALFQRYVPKGGRILDVGCGYGRTCAELSRAGFARVIGIDPSPRMIERGRRQHPELDLRVLEEGPLPFRSGGFDAALLLAVLTCIPTDGGQQRLMAEIFRVMKPGGHLLVSDYPLQTDSRNRDRYERFHRKYGTFGVFEIEDGAVVRHHDLSWIAELLSPFQAIARETVSARTMNGNDATIFQFFGVRSPPVSSALR